jgi:hypothetical protein
MNLSNKVIFVVVWAMVALLLSMIGRAIYEIVTL